MEVSLTLIGNTSKSPVLRDIRAAVGLLLSIPGITRSSRSSSPQPTVVAVLCKATVSVQRGSTSGEPLPFDRKPNTKRYRQPVGSNTPLPLFSNATSEKEWKRPSPKESEPLGCAAPVILARRKPIFSTLGLLPRSMSVSSLIGSMALDPLLHESLLSSDCSLPLKRVYQQCRIYGDPKEGI